MSNGRMRRRRLGALRGAGSGDQTAAGLSIFASRFALASTSDMANSARRDDEDYRREHDHVNGKHEQRGVPDMAQQAETVGEPPQRDRDHPGGHHHHRHRRDIYAEQVDLGEPHPGAPASKYAECWVSASDNARMLPRARRAAAPDRAASASSSRSRWAVAS